MLQSENIRNELQEISPLVADIGNVNPYTLPLNYFQDLPDNILEHIRTDGEGSFLNDYREKAKDLYQVPNDYFSSLSDKVLAHINREKDPKEELNELSPLLSEIPNSTPYTIPTNYFGELVDDVISGAQAIDFVNQKLEIESSFLHRMPRTNVYNVPPGYFFKLPYTILQKVGLERNTVPFFKTYKKVFGFAAAAIFATFISLASWLYFHNTSSQANMPELAGLEKVGADEISKYLESTPSSPVDAGEITMNEGKTDEIKQLLADISNEELEQYLDLHSVSKDLMTD